MEVVATKSIEFTARVTEQEPDRSHCDERGATRAAAEALFSTKPELAETQRGSKNRRPRVLSARSTPQ